MSDIYTWQMRRHLKFIPICQISDFTTWPMLRILKLFHMWRNFKFKHMVHLLLRSSGYLCWLFSPQISLSLWGIWQKSCLKMFPNNVFSAALGSSELKRSIPPHLPWWYFYVNLANITRKPENASHSKKKRSIRSSLSKQAFGESFNVLQNWTSI